MNGPRSRHHCILQLRNEDLFFYGPLKTTCGTFFISKLAHAVTCQGYLGFGGRKSQESDILPVFFLYKVRLAPDSGGALQNATFEKMTPCIVIVSGDGSSRSICSKRI